MEQTSEIGDDKWVRSDKARASRTAVRVVSFALGTKAGVGRRGCREGEEAYPW